MPPADPVQKHADAVAELHLRGERQAGTHQRFMEGLTGALARPRTVYLTLLSCGAWILFNGTSRALGRAALDPPPFVWLQGLIGLAALLMSTLVLITQMRQARATERRSQVDLHINLSAEQKVAKLIQLIEELRRDLPSVPNRTDAQAEQMQKPADAHDVFRRLEEKLTTPPPDQE